jgi:arylsulfatase A-like enzyme
LGYGDIGPFGATRVETPHLDQLAAGGMKLTDFYSTCSVCTPSRSSLMTGCYPRRVNMHVDENNVCVLFPGARKGLNPDEVTVAEVLKSKGYATTCIGKWHMGDHPDFLPTAQGFDSYFGIPYSNDMNRKNIPLPLMRNETVIEDSVQNDTTITQRYTEEAVQFIKSNADQPFFIYLPHTAVHLPLVPGKKFLGTSQYGKYWDWIHEIDWSLGEIVGALKDECIDQKTMIIFTSDNGSRWAKEGSNLPLRGQKGRTDEGGMRVPAIAWWPGQIPAGSVSHEIMTTMDVLPTLAHLAGSCPPSDRKIDGHNIWPILSGQSGAHSEYEAFYYYQMDQLQAVRSGDWKMFVPMESKRRNWGEPEGKTDLQLFNLAEDIHEDHNVADQHPQVVERLLGLAEIARVDLGDGDSTGTGQRAAGWRDEAAPRLLGRHE